MQKIKKIFLSKFHLINQVLLRQILLNTFLLLIRQIRFIQPHPIPPSITLLSILCIAYKYIHNIIIRATNQRLLLFTFFFIICKLLSIYGRRRLLFCMFYMKEGIFFIISLLCLVLVAV